MGALTLVMCVCVFSCAVDIVETDSLNIHTQRYTCSKSCALDSTYTIPMVYKVIYKMKCATECSKLSWCTMYSVVEDGNTSVSREPIPKSCQLFMGAASECSVTSWSASNTPVCTKVTDEDESVSTRCLMTSQKVLQVVAFKPELLVNYAYVRNLLSLGFKLGIQFVSGTSNYLFKTDHFWMDVEAPGSICISILDYMTVSPISMTVRSFCSNGPHVSDDFTPTSYPVFWDIQIPQSGKMSTNEKIFRTGGDHSALLSAINAGTDFKLLFTKDNKLLHADVILMKRNNKISVQARIHKAGQLQLLSHLTNGSTEILTWDQSTSTLSSPVSEISQTVWLSNSCWQILYNTPAKLKPQTDLRSAVESGRRIRVRFSIDSLVILATADYVQINSTSGMVTAFLLRVLVQKSFLLDIVSDLLTGIFDGATQSPTKWTHYLVTSDDNVAIFTTTVGSAEGKSSSVTADAEWFEEVRNWEQVHSSNPENQTSFSLLVAEVFNGSEVRVKIQTGVLQKWFSCDTIEVTDKGQDVKCHISSHVSANIAGSNSILPLGSQACTIKSECLVVAASEISTVVSTPCLWLSKDLIGNLITPDTVDWFVSR